MSPSRSTWRPQRSQRAMWGVITIGGDFSSSRAVVVPRTPVTALEAGRRQPLADLTFFRVEEHHGDEPQEDSTHETVPTLRGRRFTFHPGVDKPSRAKATRMSVRNRPRADIVKKKAGVVADLRVCDHAGLLFDRPPGTRAVLRLVIRQIKSVHGAKNGFPISTPPTTNHAMRGGERKASVFVFRVFGQKTAPSGGSSRLHDHVKPPSYSTSILLTDREDDCYDMLSFHEANLHCFEDCMVRL